VDARVLQGTHIGYARVRNFVDGGIAGGLRDAFASFEAQGVTGWIIDLRGNPGGRLDPDAAGLWVGEAVVDRDRGRDGVHEDRPASPPLGVIRPTVLLINNRTGSVAEAFAAALQEYGKAYVVGENSNGCVGYTSIQPLGDGSSMAVTTNVNLGPVSNKELNGAGVAPDEPVARSNDDIANGRDPQLDAAVAHLGG
jgi:carboxyl-terminal processing protease